MNYIKLYVVSALVCVSALISVQAENLSFFLNSSQFEDAFYEKVKEVDLFNDLSKDHVGSPYDLTIFFADQATSGGTAAEATSVLLAASTLGIIPIVSNDDKTLRFEIWVNRRTYATYEYTANFSDVSNMWTESARSAKIMDPKILEWALSMIDQLKLDIAADPQIELLKKEHQFYFPTEK